MKPVKMPPRVSFVVQDEDGGTVDIMACTDAPLGQLVAQVLSRAMTAYRPELIEDSERLVTLMTVGADFMNIFRRAFACFLKPEPMPEPHVPITGDRVTLKHDGSATVLVNVNGVTREYRETDVRTEGLAATGAGWSYSDGAQDEPGEENALRMWANHYGVDTSLGVSDSRVAEILIQHIDKMCEVRAEYITEVVPFSAGVEQKTFVGLADNLEVKEPFFSADDEREAHQARTTAQACNEASIGLADGVELTGMVGPEAAGKIDQFIADPSQGKRRNRQLPALDPRRLGGASAALGDTSLDDE